MTDHKNEYCQSCRILRLAEEGPVEPNFREGTDILFLLDYPSIEDCETGRVATGLSKRYTVLHKLMDETAIDPSLVSLATTIRCITRSKAILTYNDYEYCSELMIKDVMKSGVKAVLCFGSMATRTLTGLGIEKIDKLRGKVHDTRIEGVFCVVTYALSILTDEGCMGCGRSVYPHLVRKDMEMFKAELYKRRIIE
jgi:uracil-DNA glycosylase